MRHLHVSSFVVLLLALLVILAGSGARAPATAADCGDTSGGGGADVPCSCGDRVTTDTILNNTDPVTTIACPDDGLIVTNGVTLNLGGSVIRGDSVGVSDVGLLVEAGANDVVITTGTVTGFATGIATDSSTDASLLTGLQVRQNGVGIEISASNTIVEKSVVRHNDGDCIVVNDDVLVAQDKNTVRLNRCEDNGGRGLVIRGNMNTVARNVLLRNGSDGADIDGTGDTVDRNQSKYNGGEGFKIDGSAHTVTLNISLGNGADGYTVLATGSTFQRNTANYNGRAENGQPADGYGILDTTAGTGTGGTANTYAKNGCTGNGLGNSSPAGLCN